MFRRILIANRGEIAMRLIRCMKEMGIESVLAYSSEDADSLPVQMATEAVCIGPAAASASYLNQAPLVEAAKAACCDAVHPGYGFLSENADFAALVRENGLAFIGPDPETIRLMGDKEKARELMKKNGIPTVPGSDGLVDTAEEAVRVADSLGYPVLVKASAGGGGRGMRRASCRDEVMAAYQDARAEAQAAFGDSSVYLEKEIVHPHHIEFQILADRYGSIVQLGERDCSMQRRRQKMIEEAPASFLTPKLRAKMARAAVAAAKASGYVSAGTVEFVVDQKGNFYFIEMNTRIQVEHCVTEMETGIDLVREQIRIAAGMKLSIRQQDIHPAGHTIEVRINAEDPQQAFAPSPGTISFAHFPGGGGVRIESAVYSGSRISPFYDSMIAKLIVHASGRREAIHKMRAALEELTIEGVRTNIDYLYLMMFQRDYLLGQFDTSFIEENTEKILRWEKECRKKAGLVS